MPPLLLKDECYQIVGACFEVYRSMGCGFLEAVYQECLERELCLKGIPFVAQPTLPLSYKGRTLTHVYKADLICFGLVLLEVKAVGRLADEHRSQLLNYLNATGLRLGLLINFGHHPRLEWERLVR